jgi:hypothetical protein
MNRLMNIVWITALVLLGITSCKKEGASNDPDDSSKETHHPFLIVKKEQFQALRDKASAEPWKSMKEDAIDRSRAGSSNDAYKLQEYVGAAALAYILDEGNATLHAERVKDAILNKYSTVEIEESGDWGKVVKPMGSFFCAILALDVVYDGLAYADILACEEAIKDQIFKVNREGSWKTVRYGTHGIWDIYKGDRTEPDTKYYNAIMYQITPDGVSPVTNHYAWERVGGGDSRVSKAGYMDVLEFTGIDNSYYNNERLQKFHRWLFGSSINCAKEMAIFGDMLPTQGIGNYMLHRRVVNFDMEAAGYASWFLEGTPAIGHILTYILPGQDLPDPIVPSSKIYENGGAFFREKEDDRDGLHAVLYNIKSQDEWHTHYEVNGLALSGYGNRLLVNGGRLGAPVRAADLNNTLTINGDNHDARLGGGIIEGFTSPGLDFAVGSDGPALTSGTHDRSLVLVHANHGAGGYFITFDEVSASAGDKVYNYLHPANQTSVLEIAALEEYIAQIDHYPSVNGTSVGFYYVTPPVEVNIEKSQSAVPDRYPGYPDHNRLEAVYDMDTEGSKNLATIIFPYNITKSKADFQKISGEQFNGCSIGQGDVVDYVFESSPVDVIQSGGINYKAGFCLTRQVNQSTSFYLVRNGKSFSTGNVGFESDNPVTMYAMGNEGAIISDGARVKLTGPGIASVQFDPAVQILSTGSNFIEIQTGEGTFYFK